MPKLPEHYTAKHSQYIHTNDGLYYYNVTTKEVSRLEQTPLNEKNYEQEFPENTSIERLSSYELQQMRCYVSNNRPSKREVVTEYFSKVLEDAAQCDALKPLVNRLKDKSNTPSQRRAILMDFIQQIKKEKGLVLHLSTVGKKPIKKWSLPMGDSFITDNNPKEGLTKLNVFGLHQKALEAGFVSFESILPSLHKKTNVPHYKYLSRYHNCAGYTRFILEQGGINAFGSMRDLESFGVSNPARYQHVMEKVNDRLSHLNAMARTLMENASVHPGPLESYEYNFLSWLTHDNTEFDALPQGVQRLLDTYNQQTIANSSEYKIQQLVQLVTMLYQQKQGSPMVIDALQKEIRRNYHIPFDSQLTYSQPFQFKTLVVCAAIGILTFAAVLVALYFAPIIPLLLVVAGAFTTAGLAPAAASAFSFFTSKPSIKPPACFIGETLRI